MNPEDTEDKRDVVWMGEIPPGQKDKMRYPTDEEVEMALYEMENLSEEEYDAMTQKERDEYYQNVKEIIKERLKNQL